MKHQLRPIGRIWLGICPCTGVMMLKHFCFAALTVVVFSAVASAESDKPQFLKSGNGDAEYKWQHGRDSPRPASDTGAIAYLDYMPAVGLLVIGLGLTERLRERRRENLWRHAAMSEPGDGAMTDETLDEATPSFNPISAEEMMEFSRPHYRIDDPTLHVDLADLASAEPTA
jgi:hypothetical protein